MQINQKTRKEQLVIAEKKAVELFDETINRGYVEPGISEKDLSVKIHDLAFEMFAYELSTSPSLLSVKLYGILRLLTVSKLLRTSKTL